jgi:hypothetical protein
MPTVEDVTRKYIELRDRKAEIARRHQEELAPLNEAMGHIEAWLLHQMNTLGVDTLKNKAGTPYKSSVNSVHLVDGAVFKGHIFAPAIEAINHYLHAVGYGLQPVDLEAIKTALLSSSRWDMVDFRAGKKGILEYQEQNNALPPGVEVNTVTTVNVRRS